MDFYKNLWRWAPGGMILAHVVVVGGASVAGLIALGGHDRAVLAMGAFWFVFVTAIAPACVQWDHERGNENRY